MISYSSVLVALKQFFIPETGLQEFIESHKPTDVFQVENLEKVYNNLVQQKRLWY